MKNLVIIGLLLSSSLQAQDMVYYPRFPRRGPMAGDSTYTTTVTRGVLTFTAGKDTVCAYQTTTDLSKTVVLMGQTWGTWVDNANLAAVNVESNRLYFYRKDTGLNDAQAQPTIGWTKIVKTRGWKVAHVDSIFVGATTVTLPLPWKIDSIKTYVIATMSDKWAGLLNYKIFGTGTSSTNPRLFPTDSTVAFYWGTSTDGYISVQVVEDTLSSVQRDYGPSGTTSTSITRTLGSPAPINRTVILPLYSFYGTASDSAGTKLLHFNQTDSVTVVVTRSYGVTSLGSGRGWCMQMVTFADTSGITVDTVSTGFSTSGTSNKVEHAGVLDYGRVAILASGFRNMGGKGAITTEAIQAGITRTYPNDTQSFQAVRGITGGNKALTVKYFLVKYNTKELIP